MANKRVVKLVDRRPVDGSATRILRKALREIASGEVTGFAIATIHRDGTVFTYSKSEDPVKTLGALDLLRSYTLRRELMITAD